MTTEKLKPCPFCGENKKGKIYIYSIFKSVRAGNVFFVECASCRARSAEVKFEFRAIEHWNTRATEASHD